MLNKHEFDQLEKIKQLEYINKTVKDSDKTVKQLCGEIGIALSTLSDRFKSIGYKFDRKLKQYVSENAQEGTTPQKKEKATITPKKEKSVNKPVTAKNEPDENERINSNISLNIKLKKKLQVYAILHDTTLSDILNEAGTMYLEKNK